ncbi:family 16 glycosylhydrolase [Thalassobellus suaedae]|uniref:Family 16 glycosylhydrolase n=1 Tax=Thalassobellus suaedae TaxID=3074124 RepID=A0ABY9Y3B6_9FLAO|nr:family 16 glycosylhydrolase [Flavobacteriaceae bacterium HL-DH10]
MRIFSLLLLVLFISSIEAQVIQDDFEGSGTISSWYGDDCIINTNFINPHKQGINASNKVLKYEDRGGKYANVRFDNPINLDMANRNVFVFKIYVSSINLTGNQTSQVSLKLQNVDLAEAWTTQTEIIKPIKIDEWQELTFDFKNDSYINLNSNSLPPNQRNDLNRVVIQINGENNTDHVLAYIDDFYNDSSINEDFTYDKLVWFDEFNDTGAVDNTKWFHQTKFIAGNSWANGEQQHYTNREVNSYTDNGTLKIKAIRESFTDQNVTKQYTSARLNSKFAFKYGRIEVRAKLPSVSGTWPAIWLLGKNINEDGAYWDNQGFGTTGWPWCGEIDIMEPNVAKTEILGTWHWNNGEGYMLNSKSIQANNIDTSQNFHDYVLEWNATSMKIYMDNNLINEMPTVEPFNQEFFILLNVAMGGSLGGNIDSGFNNDTMEIDYIRVYQQGALSVTNDISTSKIKLYPNPVSDRLNVLMENYSNADMELQIIDVSGRLVFKQDYTINNRSLEFNTSFLKQGIYFLSLKFNDGKLSTHKFVKK